MTTSQPIAQLLTIPVPTGHMEGMLEVPTHARGLVLFAHGSGSSRHSPRNNAVARELRAAGLGTLLLDLLTPVEDQDVAARFDIALLTQRLLQATDWVRSEAALRDMPVGYFGASTGAAAALQAAAARTDISAVVSRGGRPDLAGSKLLPAVNCPTLLIVGGFDETVIELNRLAYTHLFCDKELVIVPGATHLFEEPGTLEKVAELATDWFARHFDAVAAND